MDGVAALFQPDSTASLLTEPALTRRRCFHSTATVPGPWRPGKTGCSRVLAICACSARRLTGVSEPPSRQPSSKQTIASYSGAQRVLPGYSGNNNSFETIFFEVCLEQHRLSFAERSHRLRFWPARIATRPWASYGRGAGAFGIRGVLADRASQKSKTSRLSEAVSNALSQRFISRKGGLGFDDDVGRATCRIWLPDRFRPRGR
jgi:hypothetical protein